MRPFKFLCISLIGFANVSQVLRKRGIYYLPTGTTMLRSRRVLIVSSAVLQEVRVDPSIVAGS